MKFKLFTAAALFFAGVAHAQLIDSPKVKGEDDPPFTINHAGLENLNMPTYYSAYTTEDILVVSDGTYYELFHADGRPLVDGKWADPGLDHGDPLMDNGVMIVKKPNSPYGNLHLIKHDGSVTPLPSKYRDATHFRNGVSIVQLEGKTKYEVAGYVFIDVNGKQLPSPPNLKPEQRRDLNDRLAYIAPLRDGLRAYYDEKAQKWGYCDANGKVIIAPAFDKARSFSEGLAVVVKDGKAFFIDKQGNQGNSLSWEVTWKDCSFISDYSGGMCVVNLPFESPDHLRTYYDKSGKLLGQLKYGTPMHNGTLYYMDESEIESDFKSSRAFMSSEIGRGKQIADRKTHWLPIWNDEGVLPRFDAYGVGHTDNRIAYVGIIPPQNPSYKYAYGYNSDFSKNGYATAYMETATDSYKLVVDISGNAVCIISKTTK